MPVRGTRDMLGRLSARRRMLIDRFAAHCERHAYIELTIPTLEKAELYTKTLGSMSDVVSQEMYILSRTDPTVALRPEGTAGVARALRNLNVAKKAGDGRGARVWYVGNMFRRERPQKGRWREFCQMGVECVGDSGVGVDAEVIEMAMGFLRGVGMAPRLRVNCLGGKEERETFNERLREWLKGRYWGMSEISRRRFDNGNCMRILDSKLEEDLDVLVGAPGLGEFVGKEERERFEELKLLLGEAGVEFIVDERLVRGLDYYSSTAFEFDGEQGKAICAGGRYEDVAGVSGVGFAIGLDRIEGEEGEGEEVGILEGGVVVIGIEKEAWRSGNEVGQVCRRLVREFREKGVKAVGRLEGGKLSKVVKRAVGEEAVAIVVVGSKEIEQGSVQVKFVENQSEQPIEVGVGEVVEIVKGRCKEV